ncbi:MAG: hypothetical protein OXK17_00325 [Thaumarchaeota archaeon]|nr:hypothetical protein [Nitrososphaerota archaeon]
MADATAMRPGTSGLKSGLETRLVILERKLTGSAKGLLNSDENVQRWHANLARSSRITADCRIRRLNMFYKNTGITPAGMVEIGREDSMRAEDMVLDYVTWMEAQNYSPGYVEDVVKALKSWLSYNYIDIRRRIKIANSRIPVTLQDEQVPTTAQLESIMNAADPRTRASMSLMAFAGVRPQVIGNHDGTNGLRISDIEGLIIRDDGTAVTLERTPAMVTIRPQVSKAGHKYFTFLTSQGCSYLLGYLRGRIAAGEALNPDSALICRKRIQFRQSTHEPAFVTTKTITLPIRASIRSVTKARPYVLRAYFDTQLLLAESNGCMTHAYRQFFMGHTGDMEARYTTNKGRLTEQMIEDMRGAFARSEPFLSIGSVNDTKYRREMFLQSLRQQARAYGIDPSSIRMQAENSGGTTEQSPAAAMPEDAELPQDGPRGAPPYQTKMISGEELLSSVAYGWDLVKDMPDGKFLIRRKAVHA